MMNDQIVYNSSCVQDGLPEDKKSQIIREYLYEEEKKRRNMTVEQKRK